MSAGNRHRLRLAAAEVLAALFFQAVADKIDNVLSHFTVARQFSSGDRNQA